MPIVSTATRQRVIEQERETAALHTPDERGDCVRCKRVMPTPYPNTPKTFPCGPYEFAVERLRRLGGTVSR